MALEKNIKVKIGNNDIILNDCYIKITSFNGNKDMVIYTVDIFLKKDGERIRNFSNHYTPNLENNENFIKQAYLHLKTLPEFADAIDC